MIGTLNAAWPLILLAAVLFGDALMSIRPPKFIRVCLDGVGFARDWWWTLLVIKLLAVAGLLVGLWEPGVGFAATVGIITYFACAAYSHIRAGFMGTEFWINCLGMLALALVALVFGFFV